MRRFRAWTRRFITFLDSRGRERELADEIEAQTGAHRAAGGAQAGMKPRITPILWPRIIRMNTDQQLAVRVFREIRGRFDRSVRSVARSFYRWLLEQVLEISLTLEMRSVRAAI